MSAALSKVERDTRQVSRCAAIFRRYAAGDLQRDEAVRELVRAGLLPTEAGSLLDHGSAILRTDDPGVTS